MDQGKLLLVFDASVPVPIRLNNGNHVIDRIYIAPIRERLGGCSGGQYLTWSAGSFGCANDQTGGTFAYDAFTHPTHFATNTSATNTSIYTQGVFFSSSTNATSTFAGNFNVLGNIFQNGQPLDTTTRVIWIDSNRTDTYSQDGSINRPFKTITAANAAVSSILWTSASYNITPGTRTEQGMTMPNIPLTIYGNGANIILLSGATVGAGSMTFPSDLSFYDAVIFGHVALTSTSLTNPHTFTNSFIAGNLTFAGNSTFINSAMVDQNAIAFPFLSQSASSTLTVAVGALVNVLGSNIQNVINNYGTLNLNNDAIQTATSTRYAIMSTSSGSVLHMEGISLFNLGTGGGVNTDNGATAAAPNAIANIAMTFGAGTTNAINAGTATTYISKYTAVTTAGVELVATGSDKRSARDGCSYYRSQSLGCCQPPASRRCSYRRSRIAGSAWRAANGRPGLGTHSCRTRNPPDHLRSHRYFSGKAASSEACQSFARSYAGPDIRKPRRQCLPSPSANTA